MSSPVRSDSELCSVAQLALKLSELQMAIDLLEDLEENGKVRKLRAERARVERAYEAALARALGGARCG